MNEGGAIDPRLAAWCMREVGAEPVRIEFEASHLSRVVGLELSDGRRVVVKMREPSERLAACYLAHRSLWRQGFPCPQPLVGPTVLDGNAVTAEAVIDGGESLPSTGRAPELCAAALAKLVRLAPSAGSLPTLSPPPAWVWWGHPEKGAWPPPDDLDCDLNSVAEPAWLTDVAQRAGGRCWRAPNRPSSVTPIGSPRTSGGWTTDCTPFMTGTALPEAALAGVASAIFTSTRQPGSEPTV